jgi:NADH dehydrogenase
MMNDRRIHAVTGAFGYSGRYIAARLLAKGCEVMTLTNSVRRENPFGDMVVVHPFNFDKPDQLADSLKDVSVLYNTYWVRFNHKLFTQADAVRNTETMFRAAKDAGVERIVHISITNPSEDSDLEYFRSKAKLERALKQTGVSYAILRPAILFGKEDILVNNIAWALRRFPVFGIFGDGKYRLQPIYVDDIAELAVQQGEARESVTVDAIGPETFSYRDLVKEIARIIGKRRLLVPVPPTLGYYASRAAGMVVDDVIMTREELKGLMRGLLCVDSPPAGTTKLTDWAKEHADTLGVKYASELARRRDRQSEYKSN